MRPPLKAPSLELQTLEFFEYSRPKGERRIVELRRNGFRVCLEYMPELELSQQDVLKEVVSINDVYVPMRYRCRGWLTYYLKMCERLAGGALFVPDPGGPLGQALRRKGFVPVEDLAGFLMLRK